MMTGPLPGSLSLDGKLCAVTGAASGLGRQIAETLSAAGGEVVLLDRDAAGLERTASELAGEHHVARLDVGDAEEVAEVFAGIASDHGSIDVLVNGAGVREIADSLELAVDEWDRVVRINLSGTFYCSQQAARQMRGAGGGSIVNVASVAGLNGIPARAAYCSSKFGVVGLTYTMAHDLGRFGIRVNALCPGLIRTPLTERYFADEGLVAALPKVIPLGGAGEPRHIADAALFLAGAMSEYVTGIALPVDGGYLAARSFDARIEPGGAFLATTVTDG
jgi:NAD(P)-dependent dehydrogenase (short-subunit alcohol dehydrogenase family)